MNIFPDTKLSETEEVLLAEIFANSTVKKYLHILAHDIGRNLAVAIPAPGVSDEQFIRGLIAEKGKLQLLEMLLGIANNAAQQNQSNPNQS